MLRALLVMLILLLFASTGIYFLERDAQPGAFGSIPAASWWALSTLTTVGYGDVIPVTPPGKLLGVVVMLLGVGVFALPIAIITAGFSQESMRHQFVATWSMVARIPMFANMSRVELADITKLLDTRSYDPGVPIVRAGDVGDGMYILASGEALGPPRIPAATKCRVRNRSRRIPPVRGTSENCGSRGATRAVLDGGMDG